MTGSGFDGGYWIRLDGETRKAPHAFVEALFLQRRGPNLECVRIAKRLRAIDSPYGNIDWWELDLQLRLVNKSRNIAEYVAMDMKTDHDLHVIETLRANDPQPEDQYLTEVEDADGRRLFRYRLRSNVLHAYEWKPFDARFRIERHADASRRVPTTVEVQAKDMLRRRYAFEIDLSHPGRDIELLLTGSTVAGED